MRLSRRGVKLGHKRIELIDRGLVREGSCVRHGCCRGHERLSIRAEWRGRLIRSRRRLENLNPSPVPRGEGLGALAPSELNGDECARWDDGKLLRMEVIGAASTQPQRDPQGILSGVWEAWERGAALEVRQRDFRVVRVDEPRFRKRG